MDIADELRARPALVSRSSLRTQDEVRSDIAIHLRHVQELSTYLNTFAPVSTLPSELLSNIFKHVADVSCEIFREDHWAIERDWDHWAVGYHWAVVSHVCKHWRQVALGRSSLWGNITVTRQREWMQLLLERSQETPMTVSVDMTKAKRRPSVVYNEVLASARLVLSHLPRVCTLSFRFADPEDACYDELLHGNAPLLEQLHIHNRNPSIIGPPTPSSSPISQCFHRILHHPNTRRLQRLAIYGFKVSWDSISLPSLTSLVIRLGRADMTGLLNALARMPLLQSIYLDDAVSFDSWPPPRMPRIALAHLRVLDLREDMTLLCNYRLSHLHCPSLRHLVVQPGHGRSRESEAFLAAVESILHYLGQFQTVMLRTLWGTGPICHEVYAFNEVIAGGDFRDDLCWSEGQVHHPALTIRLDHSVEAETLIKLYQLPVFEKTRSLFVTGESLQPRYWRALGRGMKGVTHLHFQPTPYSKKTFPIQALLPQWEVPVPSGGAGSVRVQALASGGNAQVEDTDVYYPFPRLRILILCHDTLIKTLNAQEYATYMTALLDCFIERYEGGAEIETLRLRSSARPAEIEAPHWHRLEEVVRFVEFDRSDQITASTTA